MGKKESMRKSAGVSFRGRVWLFSGEMGIFRKKAKAFRWGRMGVGLEAQEESS